MSRFLQRALAKTAEPERAPRAPGSGDCGELPRSANTNEPRPAQGTLGNIGDFGELVAPVTAAPWPAGVDWHLTRDAARLSGLVSAGAEWRWCPAGGLNVIQPDGHLWCLSPDLCARLQRERLLPDAVLNGVPQPIHPEQRTDA